jgi:phosphoribosylanthranilate isomerase
MISATQAAAVFDGLPRTTRRVGVFGDQTVEEIARTARIVSLDVVQLHGSVDPRRIDALRRTFTGAIWAVVRVAGATLPPDAATLAAAADGLLLDAYVAGKLGGTGVTLPWAELASSIDALRGDATIILAGGLTPDNAAGAVAVLSPDVVDVSSGVESAPGIKNHDRMRAFRDAVAHASIPT